MRQASCASNQPQWELLGHYSACGWFPRDNFVPLVKTHLSHHLLFCLMGLLPPHH